MKSKIHTIPGTQYVILTFRQVNHEKNKQIKGKITKSYTTFNENKPNLKNIKIGVISFDTNKYEILSAWRRKKQTQLFILDVSLLAFLSGDKPNINPIWANYNAYQTQTNPISKTDKRTKETKKEKEGLRNFFTPLA